MPDKDPYQEPANSTVDDWMGQEVNEDMDKADRLVAESGGDLDRAEARFAEESAGATPKPQNVDRKDGAGHS